MPHDAEPPQSTPESATGNATFNLDRQGNITAWSAAAQALFGYPRDAIVGESFASLFDSEALPFTSIHELATQVENGSGEIDCQLRHRDGTRLRASLTLLPWQNEGGEVAGYAGRLCCLVGTDEADNFHRDVLTIWESMTDAFFSLDTQWRFTYVNPQGEKLLRRTADDLRGKVLWDEFDLATDSDSYIQYRRAVQEQIPVQFETYYGPLDGWFEVYAYPSPSGLAVYFRNTNERKRHELANSYFATIAQTSDDAFIGMSMDTIITQWNRGAQKLLGYSEAEILGQPYEILVPPERKAQYHEDRIAHLASGDDLLLEKSLLRKNGTNVEASVRLSLVRSDDGELLGRCAIVRDITATRRAALEVQNSYSLLQATLESTADGIIVVDAAGQVTHYNQKFLEVCGMAPGQRELESAEQLRADVLDHLIDPDEFDRATGALYADPEAVGQFVMRFKDGRIYERFSQPQRVDGKSVGRVCSFRNVTDQYRAEASQARLNAELEFQRHRLNDILANVPGIVWETRVDAESGQQRTVYVSDYLTTMLGYQPEEWLATPEFWLTAVHPDDRAEARARAAAMLEQKCDDTFGYRMLTVDGREIGVESQCVVILNEAGEVVGRRGVTMDITDRVRAQEEQSRLAALLEATTDLVGWTDSEGRFRYINPAGRVMLGLGLDENVEGRPITDFTPERTSDALLDRAFPAAALNGSWNGETALLRKDGMEFPVSQVVIAHQDAEGNLQFFSTIARDISELKAAEAALQRHSEQLEERVQFRTKELNATNRELEAQIAERQMAVGALKEVVVQLEQLRIEADQANAELRANESHLLEGNRVFTELAGQRMTTEAEIDLVLPQITEAGSEMLDTERCSVWLYDTNRDAITCLDLYDRKAGRHSRGMELRGRDYPAYFGALHTGNIVAEDAQSHMATSELAATYLAPLGIGAMLDVAIVSGGQMIGVVCYEHVGGPRVWRVEDQTFARSSVAICALALESYERARASEALRLANEEAEAARREAESANTAKSEFLSRMSHELRTPLNAILGFGQILEMDDLPPKRRENVHHILKAGNHLLELINEVLDISRIEAGALALSLEPVPVDSSVHEVLDLVRPLTLAGNIELLNDIPLGSDWHVLADRQRLKQGLLNLISNAIKYNRNGGYVRTLAEERDDGKVLRIAVLDSGIGLSEHDITRLFTPFERLGAAHTRIEGTGIGLALTKRLVEAMGGSIGVSSTLGEGSTFWIELPLVPSPLQRTQEQREAPQAVVESSALERKTVLYIEDNLANLQLIEALLEDRADIRLLTAMQGSTGLYIAFEHRPDLVLLDLHLPDINGDEVLRRLQANAATRNTPVVIISADATPGQIERLLAAGAKKYLTKPFNVVELLRVLEENLTS